MKEAELNRMFAGLKIDINELRDKQDIDELIQQNDNLRQDIAEV